MKHYIFKGEKTMLFVVGVIAITAAIVYASYVQVHETEQTNDDE